jgi:uncharacterized membrane protein YedE/YeeE
VKRVALAGLGGVIMALGLGLAGLTDPRRIVGFLDFAGRWDPTALFVMGGAAGIFGLGFAGYGTLLRQRGLRAPARPPFSLDRPLLVGSALFGIGWGISGLCPGPAIVASAGGAAKVLLFAASMIGGSALASWRARGRAG